MVGRRLSAGVLAVLLLACVGAAGATWVVDDGDGGAGVDYTTIQAAANAADAGDTIEVRGRAYVKNVDVEKRLTLVSGDAVPVTASASEIALISKANGKLQTGIMAAEISATSIIISNEYLSMTVYPDGDFTGTNAAGECIFFPGATSDLTIKISSNEYNIQNTLSNHRTKDTYVNPSNNKEAITEWDLPEGIHVEQHIKLEGDHVTFTIISRNAESVDQDISVRYLWDTQLCDNDGSPLKAEGTLYTKEMCFDPVDFNHWNAYSRPDESQAELVTYSWWQDTPDKIIFAHWPEAIESVYSYSWDPNRVFYTPGHVTSPESDSCVLTYWEDVRVPANGEKSVTVFYGASVQTGLMLSVRLDRTEYSPDEILKIYAEVTDADGNGNFPLTKDNTEVKIDENAVNIEDIIVQPNGEYLITVKAPSDTGSHIVWVQVVTDQGSASDSKSFSVFEPFTFVHMTDVHMGWKTQVWTSFPIMGVRTITAANILSAAIDEMNDIEPDFILDTGDIADWADEGHYTRYLEALEPSGDQNRVKVYTVPGNHDRRNFIHLTDPILLAFYNYVINPRRPDGCTVLIPPNNYTFEHKGYLFIGLDSGVDHSCSNPFGTPESLGIDDDQYNILNEPTIKDHLRKIVFMHHPAIDATDDDWSDSAEPVPNNCPENGGNDGCIALHRCDFIDYCVNNHVDLVLTGHTHRNYERIVYNGAETHKTAFIQTPSLTKDEEKHGYREIFVNSDKITKIDHQLGSYSSFAVSVASPVTLHTYDSQGRHTGINITHREPERDISHSFYFSDYTFETINEANEIINVTMPETTILYDVSQDYLFKVIANLTEEQKLSPEIETFNFTVERKTTNGPLTIIFYSNISIWENTTAILPFNLTTTNYDMGIDYDGDGVIDETKSPDAIIIDYAPKAEIISPIDDSTYLFGEEIAFNGIGTDPEDGLLTTESLVWFSDVGSMIGIGNEFSEANLSVGRHNITLRVNDTLDQMNTSTVSIFIKSTQPDMFVDVLNGDETAGIEQHTSAIETLADEPCNLTVYIRNTGYGTLNNVQILTNVNVTKNVGAINEGEEKLVAVHFTPSTPGLSGLNVTVNSDEIERNITRTLLVEKFNFIVSIPKATYNQSEPVPINITVTNEVPNMRFIDLRIEINISNPIYNRTFEIPLLSLAPSETKNTSVTWDTTGVSNGTYTIGTSLMMANREVVSDEEKQVCMGEILLTDLPTAASSTATGLPKDAYRTNEDVYATGSGFAAGTNVVDIYVVPDQDWNNGDPIPADVTGSVETASVVDGDVGPVLIWRALLVPGEYDIVIDANRNGVYDAHLDGLDSGSYGFVVIAGPVLVPTLAPIGIIALIGLLCVIGMIRIRRRFN